MEITRLDFDPGTISAPAFLDIHLDDGRDVDEKLVVHLKGKAAKTAYKTLRVGDEYDPA